MTDLEFNALIENDLKKVLVSMLTNRLRLLRVAILFEFVYTNTEPTEKLKKYCMSIYNDYLKHRDDHLKLLETIKKLD